MDDFTKGMIAAVNGMLLDMLAVAARKDYEDRRRRQAQGIEKAKDKAAYKDRPTDQELHARIKACRASGNSLRDTATIVGCTLSTVQRALKEQP